MKVYNAISSQFKPPPISAQLQYVEAFDSEFTLWPSERRSASLADMMNDAIEIEINLTVAKEKMREEGDRRRDKEPKQTSSSNSQEAMMDMMMKSMENLMERLTMDNRPPPIENQKKQNTD